MKNVRDDGTNDHSKDTRRFEAEDDNGHLKGSRQANSNEQDTLEQRKQEDSSEYNQLDERSNGIRK